jgi:hypothetical protein
MQEVRQVVILQDLTSPVQKGDVFMIDSVTSEKIVARRVPAKQSKRYQSFLDKTKPPKGE